MKFDRKWSLGEFDSPWISDNVPENVKSTIRSTKGMVRLCKEFDSCPTCDGEGCKT